MSTVRKINAIRPTTVEEAVAAFQSFQHRRGRSEGTVKAYGRVLDSFSEWAGDFHLSEIGPAEIEEGFVAHWVDAFVQRRGKHPAPDTLRNVYTALSTLYNYLSNYGLLVSETGGAVANPMRAVEAPKASRRQHDWLHKAEDDALLETPMQPHERILVTFLRWTGLRLGEALALRISDVDLIEKTIRVSTSKTDNGIREVPIVPELVPEIRMWLAHLDSKGLHKPRGYFLCTTRVGRWKDRKSGRVLESEPGGPLKPQQVEKIVRRVGERAGIEGLTPHRLRRTFGSFFINAGVRLETVSKLLGHGNTNVTEQSYAQLTKPTVRDEMLDALGVSA